MRLGSTSGISRLLAYIKALWVLRVGRLLARSLLIHSEPFVFSFLACES